MWLWVEGTVTIAEQGPGNVTPEEIYQVCEGFLENLDHAYIEQEALDRLGWDGDQSVTRHVIAIILERLRDATAQPETAGKIHLGSDD